MVSNRVTRHRARQDKLKVVREHREELEALQIPITASAQNKGVTRDSPPSALERFSQHQDREIEDFATPISVGVDEVTQMLEEIHSKWDQRQVELLLKSCRNSVTSSIVGPFGLGSLVAAMDKEGGNVTTVQNADQGVYANEADRNRYDIKFDRTNYEGGGLGPKRKALFQGQDKVYDAYKGTETPKDGRTHLDHVISAKEIHDDKWLRLATESEQRDKIATRESNLVPTDSALNQSKSDRDLKEWMNSKRKDGATNAEYFGVDTRRAEAVYNEAKKDYRTQKTVAVAKHFGKELGVTGVHEGAKMGLQQSFGLLLTEFFSASFDEISDAYKHGFRDSLSSQTFFEALRKRLSRIVKRVTSRWRDALTAFKEGALSGFLSNLVTMLINTLVTTGKRIVRVIREGLMSIMKALKMALFPPEGLSGAEAADAALKLLATGVTVSLGILAEETVEKTVTLFFNTNLPVLAPYAGTVSAVFVGAMTGIASALLVYGLDKLDIFGANGAKRHAAVLQELDLLIAASEKSINAMHDDEMARMNKLLAQLQGA